MKQKKFRICLAGLIAAMSLTTVSSVDVFAASDEDNNNKTGKMLYRMYCDNVTYDSEEYYEYTYNADGKLSEVKSYDKHGRLYLQTECTYDEKGYLILSVSYDAYGNVNAKRTYQNDADGNVLLEEIKGDKDKYPAKERYEYDTDGKLIKETYSSGTTEVLYIYTYENDRLIKRARFQGKLSEEDTYYKYDNNGNLISELNNNGSGYTYEYDDDGLKIKETYIDTDGSPLKIFTFEYCSLDGLEEETEEETYISDSEEKAGNTKSDQEIPVTFKTTQWTEDVEVPKNSLGYTKYYYEITASDKEHNYFVIDEKGIIVPLINGYGIRYIASSDTDFPSVNDIKGYLPVVSLEDCDADISLNNINVENSEMSGEQKYNLSGSITTSGDSAYIVLIRIFDVDTNETLKDGYKYYTVNDGYASVEEVIARGIDEDKRNLSMEIAGVCPVASVNSSDFIFSKTNYTEDVGTDDKSVEATAQMSTTTLDNALVLYKTECNTDGKIVSNTYSTLLENGSAKVKEADYFVPLLGSMTASFEAIAAAKLYDVGTVYPELKEIIANEEKEDADVALEDKETVLSVQEALNKLGYSCGTADGILGANTKNSIIAFQKDNGLNPTGEITSGLLKQLKNESAQAPVYFGNMTPDYFNQRFLNNLNKITGGYTVSDEKMRNGYSTYDFSNSTLGTTYILMYETDSNGKISRVACVPQQFDSSYTDVMKNMITAADDEMDDYSAYTLAAKVVEEDTWNNKLFYSMDREDGILYIETVK